MVRLRMLRMMKFLNKTFLQGHSRGHEVHRRSFDALDAFRNTSAESKVARLSKHGQQNRHFLSAQQVQNEQKKDVHRTHGGRLCLLP